MKYMQVSGNNNRPGRCSDDACPCGYPGAVIEYGKGYMYIPEEVVKFRMSCPTESEAQREIQNMFGGRLVFAGQKGVFSPILMCKLGALNRGINLDVAAKDAEHWWKTGNVPLRATPLAGVSVEDVEGIAVSEDNYVIDNNGIIPISDLPIGARVTDPSWEWEFRTDKNYTGSGEVKPVTWIIVAKDHYIGLGPHVTLLAEELIGRYDFDNSTNRSHKREKWGYNHWGESGSAIRGLLSWFKSSGNATRGLRPWLNSTGIHADKGFYKAFSDSFKEALLKTTLPNKEWKNGTPYSTQDYVFIPSTTELGDTEHSNTYQIGATYPCFQRAVDGTRVALFGEKTRDYWTRSPASDDGDGVRRVNTAGEFYDYIASNGFVAVRPALNLKSEILVSEIKD